jgi:peptide/nickel transport system substrate-binding protein
MVKAQLAEVGIDVTIEVREVSIASTSFYQDNLFPVFQTEWGWTPMSDPDFARSTLMSDGFYNPGKVKNEELDSLIVKGAATYDQQERKKIYSRIMEMQLNEPMFLPLLYSRQHTAYNTRLQNLRPVMYSGNGYREIWIKQ